MKVKVASNLKRVNIGKGEYGGLIICLRFFDYDCNIWKDTVIFKLDKRDFKIINKAFKNAISNRPVAKETLSEFYGGGD